MTPAELKSLEVESTKTIDLKRFVPATDIDPLFFDSPYYLYPSGKTAAETFKVICAAMTDAGVAGIGTLTLARRERQVLVRPRDGGMVLITLRASDEVRAAEFGDVADDADPEMVDIAGVIIHSGAWALSTRPRSATDIRMPCGI